uniref:Growth hormone-inducible transmembrane protein n=1 Tax=Romanomermis culicivorax TaxID=13658 RepID=A0A915KM40_ROMCU
MVGLEAERSHTPVPFSETSSLDYPKKSFWHCQRCLTGRRALHARLPILKQGFCPSLLSLRLASNNVGSGFKIRPQVKPLRQILQTGATDTPLAYGKIFAMGGAAVGVGMLCYYGLGLSRETGAIDRAALWPEYVRDRIHKTYMYLGGGLGLTAGSAALVFRSPALMNIMTKNSILITVIIKLSSVR